MTHKLKLQLVGMVEEGMTYQNSLAVESWLTHLQSCKTFMTP